MKKLLWAIFILSTATALFSGGVLFGLTLPKPDMPTHQAMCVHAPVTLDNLLISINEYRLEKSLPQLQLKPQLIEYADDRAHEIAETGQMVHQSKLGNYFEWRGRSDEFATVTELLTTTRETSCSTVEEFKKSPTHNDALVDPKATQIGIGLNNNYVTVEVAK